MISENETFEDIAEEADTEFEDENLALAAEEAEQDASENSGPNALGPIHRDSSFVYNIDKPDMNGWTSGSIWPSGQVLAELLSREPERIRGK